MIAGFRLSIAALWLIAFLPLSFAAEVSLNNKMLVEDSGLEMWYSKNWKQLDRNSPIHSYYACKPLSLHQIATYALAGPSLDGFAPTINIQIRPVFGAVDERMRRETIMGIKSIASKVKGASMELLDDRITATPSGNALLLEYCFNNEDGRKLQSQLWIMQKNSLAYSFNFTDQSDRFDKSRDLVDAMIDSVKFSPLPKGMSYDESIKLWMSFAIGITLFAMTGALFLYRRAQAAPVEEYPVVGRQETDNEQSNNRPG
jgi:hypothetical protein